MAINGGTDSIKDIAALDQNSICDTLKTGYDLNSFKFYNTVQALLYASKASRVDSEKKMTKITFENDLKINMAVICE